MFRRSGELPLLTTSSFSVHNLDKSSEEIHRYGGIIFLHRLYRSHIRWVLVLERNVELQKSVDIPQPVIFNTI